MSPVSSVLDPVRRALLEGASTIRAAIPPLAVEVGTREVVLARVRRSRGKRALEAVEERPIVVPAVEGDGDTPPAPTPASLEAAVRATFEASKTKPGKLTLVLPDSFAKVSIVTLPERPKSAKQLHEMVRFKLRRSIPFRVEDAAIAHQLLPDTGPEPSILVAVMQRSIVSQYETMLAKAGCRPGMVGLATVQLINLYREALEQASGGQDAAFLNCTESYFSLVLVRDGKLIFFRCKAYPSAEDVEGAAETMAREMASSLSYYEEKLAGRGIATAFVRTIGRPLEEIEALLERLGIARVEAIDLGRYVTAPEGRPLDPLTMHRVAPAVAAAVGGW